MYKTIDMMNKTQEGNLKKVKTTFLNKIGWFIVKRTCKHESTRTIFIDHCDGFSHEQCNICGKELWLDIK